MQVAFSTTSPVTNIFVTVMVFMLAVLLPFVDRRICGHYELHPGSVGGESDKQHALLILRHFILFFILLCYGLVVAYLVFFSRVATSDYQIHIELMGDLQKSISIDSGILGVIEAIEASGLKAGLALITINSFADIAQVYLNIMLFVPLGYLLPYCFRFFSAKPVLRTVVAGFVISFVIENLQLIFKRGFYDVDDLLANTLGTLIGALLYRIFAFTVTHPDWRQDIKDYHRWMKISKKHLLFPFGKSAYLSRTTLYVSSEKEARDFFALKMGFRPMGELDRDDGNSSFLFHLGSMQLEVICLGEQAVIQPQQLTLAIVSVKKAYQRLQKKGIDLGLIETDIYTGLRKFSFQGPDNITISIIG